jgi:hypothetical protein
MSLSPSLPHSSSTTGLAISPSSRNCDKGSTMVSETLCPFSHSWPRHSIFTLPRSLRICSPSSSSRRDPHTDLRRVHHRRHHHCPSGRSGSTLPGVAAGPAGSTSAAEADRTGRPAAVRTGRLEAGHRGRGLVGMGWVCFRSRCCWEHTGPAEVGRPGSKAQRLDGSVEALVGTGEVHPGPRVIRQQLIVVLVYDATGCGAC